jgi:ADP-heptose:LPS heptosyltransferase
MPLLTKLSSLGHLALQSALDRAAAVSVQGQAAPAGEGPLVIVRVDAIGDFVVWLASAEALVARHRPRRVILIANQLVAELARATGIFDEVVPLDLRAFQRHRRYRFSMLRRVRALGAAIAIQPTYSRAFWMGDALIRATGAPERIGQQGDLNNIRPWQRRLSDRWYTRLVAPVARSRHEMQRNADFLRTLGVSSAIPACARLGPVGARPDALDTGRAYFVVMPGAGSPRRMWPVERFAALARQIATARNLRLVICGSPGETALAAAVAEAAGLDDALLLAGETSLPQLVETIRGACLTIANDSSAIHIAAAVGTPSVCLLGGGHYARFLPYPDTAQNLGPKNRPTCVHAAMPCFNCNWQCSQPHGPDGPFPCIEAITLGSATTAALRQLDLKDMTV